MRKALTYLLLALIPAIVILIIINTPKPPLTQQQLAMEFPEGYDKQMLLTCKNKAKPVGQEGFLGVCKRTDSIEQTYAIIYDSTDEILTGKRSTEWKHVAHSLDHEAPFGITGFVAQQIAKHYYDVTFVSDLLPDL